MTPDVSCRVMAYAANLPRENSYTPGFLTLHLLGYGGLANSLLWLHALYTLKDPVARFSFMLRSTLRSAHY